MSRFRLDGRLLHFLEVFGSHIVLLVTLRAVGGCGSGRGGDVAAVAALLLLVAAAVARDRGRDLKRVADLAAVPRRRGRVALVPVEVGGREGQDTVRLDLERRVARDPRPLELDIHQPV